MKPIFIELTRIDGKKCLVNLAYLQSYDEINTYYKEDFNYIKQLLTKHNLLLQ